MDTSFRRGGLRQTTLVEQPHRLDRIVVVLAGTTIAFHVEWRRFTDLFLLVGLAVIVQYQRVERTRKRIVEVSVTDGLFGRRFERISRS